MLRDFRMALPSASWATRTVVPRAAKLMAEHQREIAEKAAAKRWEEGGTMARSAHIQFRAGLLESAMMERSRETDDTTLAGIAQRDLARYYQVLADELARVRLTEGEASLIVDALNSTLLEPQTYRYLWAEVSDSLDELTEKWGVDGPRLVEKLRGLPPGATMAVVDAAERFWRLPDGSTPERLRAVGLVR